MIASLLRAIEFALAILFLYLGATKLFASDALTVSRALIASAEMIVGVLIVAKVSERVSTPAVIVIATAEVALFSRSPLAAIACVSAHGLTTWGRIALNARARAHSKLPSS